MLAIYPLKATERVKRKDRRRPTSCSSYFEGVIDIRVEDDLGCDHGGLDMAVTMSMNVYFLLPVVPLSTLPIHLQP